MKYTFKDDYSEGCHPTILDRLHKINLEQTVDGNYGLDQYSQQAKKLIHNHLENPDAEIHLVSGGTQANLIIISTFLKPYEAVISADSGHIAVHETGAIEATGHKVITVPSKDGKLYPSQIEEIIQQHHDEHMVLPKMVYISNATEIGTVYSKKELEDLSKFCQTNKLYLFMDGARLGSALTSAKNDLTLKDIAQRTDVFYIGGTKNGALLGEAIVINNAAFQQNFRYAIKQKGALLAKGRLLGIQFLGLFQENLFFELGEHANERANQLYLGLQQRGIQFTNPIESNQIFPILPKELSSALSKLYSFHIWESYDENQDVVRLVTSWATSNEIIQTFLDDVDNFI